MKTGFTPIRLREYVELHRRANPEVKRTELIQQLESAIAAYRAGTRCQCRASIRNHWVGSGWGGLLCLHHGQTELDQDYDIDLADEEAAG